jgi:hypothetical protein
MPSARCPGGGRAGDVARAGAAREGADQPPVGRPVPDPSGGRAGSSVRREPGRRPVELGRESAALTTSRPAGCGRVAAGWPRRTRRSSGYCCGPRVSAGTSLGRAVRAANHAWAHSPREAFPALIVFRNVSGGMGVPSGTCGDEEPRGRNTDINTVSGPNNY